MTSPQDFDFQQGHWRVAHRQLKGRLVDCTDWEEFDGTCEMRLILGGNGNIEDNLLQISTGSYRAVALRCYDPASATWAIWWLDDRRPHALDVPVIGRFEDGIGSFYADDTLNGTPIKVRFLWLDTATETPRWEQAVSLDSGESWETNWIMNFERHA